jgi:hypothetical protein
MNWIDYQAKRKELHIAYHAAKRAGELAEVQRIEGERDTLEDEHERLFDLDGAPILGRGTLRARVGFAGLQPWLQIQLLDDEGRVNIYGTEFGTIPSSAMRQLVQVQRLVELYIAGKIDALPHELQMPPYSCPTHANATEGFTAGCYDCIPG